MGRHRRGRHRRKGKPIPLVLVAAGACLAAGWEHQSPAQAVASGVAVVAAEHSSLPWKAVERPKPDLAIHQTAMLIHPSRQLRVSGRRGLTANAENVLDWVDLNYPALGSVGGVRSDPLPDHPSGHALDLMVYGNRELGDTLLRDLLDDARELHVRYVIWQQIIYYPSGVHYMMRDAGSPTANHRDHVHVTVW